MNFYYFYNRIESAAKKKTVLTLKFKRQRHDVHEIICFVPSRTMNRKIRPYCVVGGKAHRVRIRAGIAVIN